MGKQLTFVQTTIPRDELVEWRRAARAEDLSLRQYLRKVVRRALRARRRQRASDVDQAATS